METRVCGGTAIKDDPLYKEGKPFHVYNTRLITFGGKDQLGAGDNNLTWAVRHANVRAWAEVNADGTFTIECQFEDILNLESNEEFGFIHNSFSDFFGFFWHTLAGGNINMQVRAKWKNYGR